MINKNRIVPVTKTDLLTLYATMFMLSGQSNAKTFKANDVEGNYDISEDDGQGFLDQPVKSIRFLNAPNNLSVFFVASYDFEGITLEGNPINWESEGLTPDDIVADGATLYHLIGVGETFMLLCCSPVES